MGSECDCGNLNSSPILSKVFLTTGILTAVMAFGQSVLQLYALRISVKFYVIPYIWFFVLDTWATIIFLGYTIRLLYLVRCMRCSELSRIWWYIAVVNMVVNPAQSAWWWFSEDYALAYVAIPASILYIFFFILVCRNLTPGRFKRHKHKENNIEAQQEETIEL